MMELIDVHITFGSTRVLKGANGLFQKGRATGLIGDNAAGKTTLLRAACTIIPPARGEIRLEDAPLFHDDATRRAKIGALIEQPGHYDELTVLENLEFFFSFHANAGGELQQFVSRALEQFDLNAVRSERVGKLSAGFRLRVALARAFHPGARVVLLDEPFSGLDPTTRMRLKATVRQATSKGIAVVISSHDLSDLDTVCDSLYVLAAGKLHHFSNFTAIRKHVGAAPDSDLDHVYAALRSQLCAEAS